MQNKFQDNELIFRKQDRVTELISSTSWLKLYGLKKLKLDFMHVLSTIGFKNSDDYIHILKKPVSSRYSIGLFKKVAYKNGTFYNVIASRNTLVKVEENLKHAVEMYKRRLEWLTTSSRRTFGVIQEKRVCIIIDIEETSDIHFESNVQVLKSLIKEQISKIQKFNFLRATADESKCYPKCVPVNGDTCSEANEWLNDLTKRTEYNSTSLLQSILDASSDSQVEAIYVYTDGSFCKSGLDILTDKVKDVLKPIHLVYIKKSNSTKLGLLKNFADSKSGRFHVYDCEENNNSMSSSSKNSHGMGVRKDVMMIWEELDVARNTLFDVQSLLSDLETTSLSNKLIQEEQKYKLQSSKPQKSTNEFSMSSREWLKKYGLKKVNLTLYSYLKDSAFHHCDGVLDTQPGADSRLVNAKYCSKFAHLKWFDGSVKHVHVTESSFNRFKSRIMLMLGRYRQRLDWLQKGSRELFGTIIEDQVVILIDTSFSMDSRLHFVKEKLLKLFQEQLVNKVKFNLIHFDSNVESWRDHLVACNSENLENAWYWVKALEANGSTNTLRAIHLAYSMQGVEALYLLTDGRPDQLPQKIFSHINKTIPIHAISFNCNDVEANEFLNQLSSMTGGRYHFFSEDITSDSSSPSPFQSEDIYVLKNEIEKGLNDLKTMSKLQKECFELDIMNKERRLLKSTPYSTQRNNHIEHRPQLFPGHTYINNRASLLRITPPKETKTHHAISDSPTIRNISSKKKRRSAKPEMKNEIKRWLNENSIKAQKLTLMDDVLAPTVINHNPKYVPALKKDVVAKVYDEMLPIVHTTMGKGGKYQLVNPHAVDLIWYEEKLTDCLKKIETKLNNYVSANINDELRQSLTGDSHLPLSYVENKSVIDEDLREQDLQTVINNKILLEKELEKGKIFLQQSKDLRQIVQELAKEKKQAKQDAEDEKAASKRLFPNANQPSATKGRIRYHRVLARSDLDGFYYPAIVNKHVNDRFVNVCFDNGENQICSVRYVVSIGGSTACPSLNVGDYVLVKCSTYSDDDQTFFYVPGIIQVTPLRMKSGNKCYTVIRYNGLKITSVRKDLIKITRSRFVFSTRFIQERQSDLPSFHSKDSSSTVSSKASSLSSVHSIGSYIATPPPPAEDESIPAVVSNEVSQPNDPFEQRVSSTEKDEIRREDQDSDTSSSETSDDESNKEAEDTKVILELAPNSDERDKEKELEANAKHIFEEWKVLFEEQHHAKMKELEEQKELLIEMQSSLKLTEEKQSAKERLLEEQQQRFQQQQQLFFEKQLQHQNQEQQTLKENFKDLTELQKEIFKRQQEQESQLMKHLLAKEEVYQQQQEALQKVLRMKDEETNTDQFSPAIEHTNHDLLPPSDDFNLHPTSSFIEENPTPPRVTSESYTEDADIQVFLDPSNEAVLMAQGDSGILLSRHPPDEDPAVMIRRIPTVLQTNQEILACFKDDGWYYRATIKKLIDDSHYLVEDGLGDIEHVSRKDILCDNDDADNIIRIGDCVVALHPRYQYAYAPGIVHDVEADGALKIRFYDSQLSVVPRAETYLISTSKYEQDCNRIRKCEDALLGQAVVCRDDKTGVYQLASVRDRVAGSRNYLIEWADQRLDVQNYAYIFGAHTKRQKITANSYVLAITNFDLLTYLPGVVLDVDETNFKIQFCDSNSLVSVAASHCFWISPDYYRNAVKYWNHINQKST